MGLRRQRLSVLTRSERGKQVKRDRNGAAAAKKAKKIGSPAFALLPSELGCVRSIVDGDVLDRERKWRVFGQFEEAGAEWEELALVADRTFGKEAQGLMAANGSFHFAKLLPDSPAAVTVDEDGGVLLAQPAHDGVGGQALLGNESAVGGAGEDKDVQPADVIGDDQGLGCGL